MSTLRWEKAVAATGCILVAVAGGCSSHSTVNFASADRFAERGEQEATRIADRDPRDLPMFDGRSGQPLSWNQTVTRAAAADVVILGEQHDDAVAHAVQFAFVQDLAARLPSRGALTMEMLERDEQPMIDDYLEGLIDADTFAKLTDSASWAGEGSWAMWYQPTIDAAAMRCWPVIGANAPRRYVRLARTAGYARLNELPHPRRAFLALPRTAPRDYYERFMAVMAEGHAAATAPTTAPATAPANSQVDALDEYEPGFRSQLLWDSTMADSMWRALRRGARPVVHLVGQFHSDFAGGTVQELRARDAAAIVLTVSMQRDEGAALRDNDRDRADIVIYTGRRADADAP